MSELWKRIAEGVRAELPLDDSHPSPEELLAYHQRKLAVEGEEVIKEHLAGCPECSELVLELTEHWQIRGEPWHRRVEPLRVLAAASLAMTLGLSVWLALLGTTRVGDRGFIVSDLKDEGSPTRGERQVVVLPEWAKELQFILPVVADQAYAAYGIEIRAANGSRMVQALGMRLNPGARLSLTVPRSNLPAGEYRLSVLGFADPDAEGEPLDTYPFRLELRGDEL